jgi:hypothetical protein
MQFSDGTYDSCGRPAWQDVPNDVDATNKYFKMFPTTYGCNLSHVKAWRDFLSSDELWTIVIEDDVEPALNYHSISIPDDCGMYYLLGSSHPGCRLSLYDDDQVQVARTLAGYLISRKAAELALMAMRPIQYYQCDHQVPLRCFASVILRGNFEKPNWSTLPYAIKAYGQEESILVHTEKAKRSTFTADGTKPWISPSLLPGDGIIA